MRVSKALNLFVLKNTLVALFLFIVNGDYSITHEEVLQPAMEDIGGSKLAKIGIDSKYGMKFSLTAILMGDNGETENFKRLLPLNPAVRGMVKDGHPTLNQSVIL